MHLRYRTIDDRKMGFFHDCLGISAAIGEEPRRALGGLVEVGMTPGEVLDRLSILDIKQRRLKEGGKASIARKQYAALFKKSSHLLGGGNEKLAKINVKYNNLLEVNERLWEVEDRVRHLMREATDHDHAHSLGFTEIAASVPILNDVRARLKNEIDEVAGCGTTEVKGYV